MGKIMDFFKSRSKKSNTEDLPLTNTPPTPGQIQSPPQPTPQAPPESVIHFPQQTSTPQPAVVTPPIYQAPTMPSPPITPPSSPIDQAVPYPQIPLEQAPVVNPPGSTEQLTPLAHPIAHTQPIATPPPAPTEQATIASTPITTEQSTVTPTSIPYEQPSAPTTSIASEQPVSIPPATAVPTHTAESIPITPPTEPVFTPATPTLPPVLPSSVVHTPPPIVAPKIDPNFITPGPTSLGVFTPVPELLSISTQLSRLDITKEYALQLEKLSYQSSLSKNDFKNILDVLSTLSSDYTKALSQIKDPVDVLSEYLETCISLSHYVFPPEIPTYENFLTIDGFEKFKKSILILLNFKKLFPQLFEDATLNLDHLTTEYSSTMALFNQVTPKVQEMIPAAEALRTEIINFTNTINQVESKNKMSPDWNGKKQQLMQFRQQLVQRREAFIADTEQLNEIIDTLYNKSMTLHDEFRRLCPTFVNVIKSLIDTTPRDTNITNKRQQIEYIAQTLSSSHLQLESFQTTLPD